MTRLYYRPLAQTPLSQTPSALPLAGGFCSFEWVQVLSRTNAPQIIPAEDLPADVHDALTAPRPAIAGLNFATPQIMGIVNVTPDSFSDGGKYNTAAAGVAHALQLQAQGADILDIGGESTRPGADTIEQGEEAARVTPVISGISRQSNVPISIDTRKAQVAKAAIAAGATLINDVSAMTYDAAMQGIAAQTAAPICLMHAQGDPQTMQADPHYDNVVLDVYDYLHAQIERAVAGGISRSQIIIDVGIGFGKTLEHNLQLLQNLSLFHALGCPVLLGASRKKFIGTLGGADTAGGRMPGSVAVALAGLAQGVQITRVHDVAETKQAFTLWQAACAISAPE